MRSPLLSATSLIIPSVGGSLYISSSDKNLIYTVGDSLKYSGFTLYSPDTTFEVDEVTRTCKEVFNDMHLLLSNSYFQQARKYCVVPRTFADLAKHHGFEVIDVWNSPSSSSSSAEDDLLWSLKLKDDNTSYESDWGLISTSTSTSTDSQNKTYTKDIVKSALNEELKQVNDTNEKDKYAQTVADVLNKYEDIQELKLACWSLASQTHNDEKEEESWYLFLKYCTRKTNSYS